MERPSFIYWLLAVHLTILQANRVLDGLGLQELRIDAASQVANSSGASHPAVTVDHGLESGVGTTNFQFGISKRHLAFTPLKKIQASKVNVQDWNDGDGTVGIPKEDASKQEAYRLAKHWLKARALTLQRWRRSILPGSNTSICP